MQHKNITFIGTGNMATALIRGLIGAHYPGQCITAHDLNPDKSQALATELGIRHEADPALAVKNAAIIVLAVKPNGIRVACQTLKDHLQHKPCIISVAAGVQLATIARFLETDALAMVRCMPNTPALIGCGATGLYANANADHAEREWAESLFRAVGIVHWCNQESALDAITALSGCGPAYIFLVMEAMQEAAEALGLDENLAKSFSIQTVLGASRVALETMQPFAELCKQVASPGGSTEKALEVLEQGNLKALFTRAIESAYNQAKVLSTHYDTV